MGPLRRDCCRMQILGQLPAAGQPPQPGRPWQAALWVRHAPHPSCLAFQLVMQATVPRPRRRQHRPCRSHAAGQPALQESARCACCARPPPHPCGQRAELAGPALAGPEPQPEPISAAAGADLGASVAIPAPRAGSSAAAAEQPEPAEPSRSTPVLQSAQVGAADAGVAIMRVLCLLAHLVLWCSPCTQACGQSWLPRPWCISGHALVEPEQLRVVHELATCRRPGCLQGHLARGSTSRLQTRRAY